MPSLVLKIYRVLLDYNWGVGRHTCSRVVRMTDDYDPLKSIRLGPGSRMPLWNILSLAYTLLLTHRSPLGPPGLEHSARGRSRDTANMRDSATTIQQIKAAIQQIKSSDPAIKLRDSTRKSRDEPRFSKNSQAIQQIRSGDSASKNRAIQPLKLQWNSNAKKI